MKKILLSFCLLGASFYGNSQVIFSVTSPASMQGGYPLTYAKTADGWGTPDLTIPANAVQDTLVFVGDGTAADSLNCGTTTTPTSSISGHIAVLYRGSCDFGTKALNAYTAGAIAVVIINNIPGSPIEMAPSTDGPNALIPVIMISDVAGAALHDSIMARKVVAFIGNKQNFYANDIGIQDSTIIRADRSSNVALINQNAAEFHITPGAWVSNFGSSDQSAVTLSATISFGGASIYNHTSTPVAIPSGDSVYIALPLFSQASYANGKYAMTYITNMSNTDDYMADDTIHSDFYFDDHLYAFSQLNNNMTPKADSYYRPSGTVSSFSSCVYFRDSLGSKLAAVGMNFSASTIDSLLLTNEYLDFYVWKWDDVFTDLNGPPTFNNINIVGQGEYTYLDNLQDSNIYVPFDSPVTLLDNQRYMFCINTQSTNVYLGFDTKTDYTENINDFDTQPLYPIEESGTWYGLGFGATPVPAITVNMIDASTLGIKENAKEVTLTPYPNPTSNSLTIPLGNLTGNATLNVVDLTGKVVKNQQVSLNGSSNLKVDVSDMASGTYIFKMSFENGQTAQFRIAVNK